MMRKKLAFDRKRLQWKTVPVGNRGTLEIDLRWRKRQHLGLRCFGSFHPHAQRTIVVPTAVESGGSESKADRMWSGQLIGMQEIVFPHWDRRGVLNRHILERSTTRSPVRFVTRSYELLELFPLRKGAQLPRFAVVLNAMSLSPAEQQLCVSHLETIKAHFPGQYRRINLTVLRCESQASVLEQCSAKEDETPFVTVQSVISRETREAVSSLLSRNITELDFLDDIELNRLVPVPESHVNHSELFSLTYTQKGVHRVSPSGSSPVFVYFGSEEKERLMEMMSANPEQSYCIMDGQYELGIWGSKGMIQDHEPDLVITERNKNKWLHWHFSDRSAGHPELQLEGELGSEASRLEIRCVEVRAPLSNLELLKLYILADTNGYFLRFEEPESATLSLDDNTTYLFPGETAYAVTDRAVKNTLHVSHRFPESENLEALLDIGLPRLSKRSQGLRWVGERHFYVKELDVSSVEEWVNASSKPLRIDAFDWNDKERTNAILQLWALSRQIDPKKQPVLKVSVNGAVIECRRPLELILVIPKDAPPETAAYYGDYWKSIEKYIPKQATTASVNQFLAPSRIGSQLPRHLRMSYEKAGRIETLFEGYRKRPKTQRGDSFTQWFTRWTWRSLQVLSRVRGLVAVPSLEYKRVSSPPRSNKVLPAPAKTKQASKVRLLASAIKPMLICARQSDPLFRLGCPFTYVVGDSLTGARTVIRETLADSGYTLISGNSQKWNVKSGFIAGYRELQVSDPRFFDGVNDAMDEGYPVIVHHLDSVDREGLIPLYQRLVNRDFQTGFALIGTGASSGTLYHGLEALAVPLAV